MNKATISGTVLEEPYFILEEKSELFYRTEIAVRRNSGVDDIIPVVLSETLVDMVSKRSKVKVTGEYRSRMSGRLQHYILADTIQISENHENHIELIGTVCKQPIYRTTPLKREITDIFIAVDKSGRSDYIPCVAWWQGARYAAKLTVGDKVHLSGRIQSREYQKDGIIRRINEVSIAKIKEVLVENEEKSP